MYAPKTRRLQLLILVLSATFAVSSLMLPDPILSIADRIPDGLFVVFAPISIPLMMLQGYAFPIGSAIALGVLGRFLATPNQEANRSALVAKPLAIALLGLAFIALQSLVFLSIPEGTSIRPMMWSTTQMLSIVVLTVWVFDESRRYLRKGGRRSVAVLAIVLSLCSLPTMAYSFGFVVNHKNLLVSP